MSAILSSVVGPNSDKDGMHHTVTKHRGIITLYRHQKAAFAITSRRGPTPKAPKAPIADLPTSSSGSIPTELDEVKSKDLHFQLACPPVPFISLNSVKSIALQKDCPGSFPESVMLMNNSVMQAVCIIWWCVSLSKLIILKYFTFSTLYEFLCENPFVWIYTMIITMDFPNAVIASWYPH